VYDRRVAPVSKIGIGLRAGQSDLLVENAQHGRSPPDGELLYPALFGGGRPPRALDFAEHAGSCAQRRAVVLQ
jgi:hypothetical protein